jgi:RsiW-degrading membrane proteinase PrsW (M82 family)
MHQYPDLIGTVSLMISSFLIGVVFMFFWERLRTGKPYGFALTIFLIGLAIALTIIYLLYQATHL